MPGFDFGTPWQHRQASTPLGAQRLNEREALVAAKFDEIDGTVGTFAATAEPQLTIADIPEPWHLPHRGAGANLAPDGDLRSMRLAIERGAKLLEGGDIQSGKDGSLLWMHDGTVDRTTDRTGNVFDYSALGWKTLTLDTASHFLASWPNVSPPPTLQDALALARSAGRCLGIEQKVHFTSHTQAMVDAVLQYGMRKSAIFESFDRADLDIPKAAGIKTMLILDNGSTYNIAQITATAPDYVAYNWQGAGLTTTYLGQIAALGIKLAPYTFQRRKDWDAEVARVAAAGLVLVGAFSDDPFWTARTSPVANTDPFIDQTWADGMIPSAGLSRGTFTAPNKLNFGANSSQVTMQGWGSQDAAPQSITFTVTYDQLDTDATRWGGIAFGQVDDEDVTDVLGHGYVVFVRQDGGLNLFRRDGASSVLIQSVAGGGAGTPAIPLNGSVTIKVEFLAANVVKATRMDTGTSVQGTDATYRGGYFHFIKLVSAGASKLHASFSAVTVVR